MDNSLSTSFSAKVRWTAIFVALYRICFKIKQKYNSRNKLQNWPVNLEHMTERFQNQCKSLSLKNSKLANGNLSIEITSVRCNIFASEKLINPNSLFNYAIENNICSFSCLFLVYESSKIVYIFIKVLF